MTEKKASHENLMKAVDTERKTAAVRSLDLSFNELADMYKTKELRITPEYQRTFRWSDVKQSQFLESIILEMPVPPIYVVEVGEGKWELIDGLQRLSTYLHCRGELDLPDRNPPIKKGIDYLKLSGCDIVRELNGYGFDDLTTSLQYRVRRATLRVELVRRETPNPRFAYYMFKRLNTGGEPLSDQEARNCSIRLLGTTFNDFIVTMSKNEDFQKCVDDVTEEYRSRMGLEELVLRFFAFKNKLDEYVHDIDPFLTRFMELVTDETSDEHIPFAYVQEQWLFEQTFKILAATLGPRACRRWVGGVGSGYGGGFSISHYEAFSIGLAQIVEKLPEVPSADTLQKMLEAMQEAKKDPKLKTFTTGGGKNFRRLYEKKIALVSDSIRASI